jgi:hypothetical protein
MDMLKNLEEQQAADKARREAERAEKGYGGATRTNVAVRVVVGLAAARQFRRHAAQHRTGPDRSGPVRTGPVRTEKGS